VKLTINSELSLKGAQIALARQWKKDKFIVMTIQKQQRTLTQNKAIHVLFDMIAYELKSNKLDIKKTLRHDFAIPWTAETVKELIWKPVQQAMFETESTKELTTDQVSKVFDVIRDHLYDITIGEIDLEFPSKDNM